MIKTQEINEYHFGTFDEVVKHTQGEKEKIVLLPLKDFMGASAKISFKEDEYLSSPNGLLRFNAHGLRSLCIFYLFPSIFCNLFTKKI